MFRAKCFPVARDLPASRFSFPNGFTEGLTSYLQRHHSRSPIFVKLGIAIEIGSVASSYHFTPPFLAARFCFLRWAELLLGLPPSLPFFRAALALAGLVMLPRATAAGFLIGSLIPQT